MAQIQQPFPAIQIVKPRTTAEYNAANPSAQGHDYDNLTGYAQHWSLNIEREIFPTVLWEIAYAGSRGIHVMINLPLNEVQPGLGSQASRRLIQPLNNITATSIFAPRNMSTFHSMQNKVVKRFSSGLQFLFSYTYGKSLDFGGSAGSAGGSTGTPRQSLVCAAAVDHPVSTSSTAPSPATSMSCLSEKESVGWQITPWLARLWVAGSSVASAR